MTICTGFREVWSRCAGEVRRFALDDAGQDLVEYGLLTAFVGVVGVLVLDAIGVEILNTYTSWIDPNEGVPSLWIPPEPAGSAP